jgi:uncharacterized membrane protein YphA (DoxX/SURF4 family)
MKFHEPLSRRVALSAANNVNGFTRLFMVLLRIAIGWHVGYEGWQKIQSHELGQKPFSSEMYLRSSTGPFRDRFRGLVDDFHGLRKLYYDWQTTADRYARYYDFNEEQQQALTRKLEEIKAKAKEYLTSAVNTKKIDEYKKKVELWIDEERKQAPAFAEEVSRKAQRELNTSRLELTGPINDLTADLRAELQTLTADKSLDTKSAVELWYEDTPTVQRVDTVTMWGLFLCGAGMVLGLFSRLSALGTAVFLSLFYFSLPPWPGLPPAPIAEGTYLIVNKNLVELLACLMLATVPTGVWAGLDAIIRGLITRPIFGVGAREFRESR